MVKINTGSALSNKYSDDLETLEQEVNILSGQLLQLEIIQTYKTSPETVEQIFDRPQTVKLDDF
jgi:hypothetical protein